MTRDTLFYVTSYMDHLNAHIPEHSVIDHKHVTLEKKSTPYFRTPNLRAGKIPGVRPQTLPDIFPGWEYWICDWTTDDMAAMNVVPEFVADEKYIGQWPDAWFMGNLYLNAKAREAFEKHAPDKCLFFPMQIFAKQTGEPLDVQRWIAYPRHWFQVSGDELPLPECDFDPNISHGSEIFRAAQRSQEVCDFLNELSLFSSTKGAYPVYNAALFDALKRESLTGLTEKRNKSITFHDFRDVITHVWV